MEKYALPIVFVFATAVSCGNSKSSYTVLASKTNPDANGNGYGMCNAPGHEDEHNPHCIDSGTGNTPDGGVADTGNNTNAPDSNMGVEVGDNTPEVGTDSSVSSDLEMDLLELPSDGSTLADGSSDNSSSDNSNSGGTGGMSGTGGTGGSNVGDNGGSNNHGQQPSDSYICRDGIHHSNDFWLSPHGLSLVNWIDLNDLRFLNLKLNGDTDFNPTSTAELQTWLAGPSLSVQLAMLELSVHHGFVRHPNTTTIAVPTMDNSVNLAWFMDYVNTILEYPIISTRDMEVLRVVLGNANCDLLGVETATYWPEPPYVTN